MQANMARPAAIWLAFANVAMLALSACEWLVGCFVRELNSMCKASAATFAHLRDKFSREALGKSKPHNPVVMHADAETGSVGEKSHRKPSQKAHPPAPTFSKSLSAGNGCGTPPMLLIVIFCERGTG